MDLAKLADIVCQTKVNAAFCPQPTLEQVQWTAHLPGVYFCNSCTSPMGPFLLFHLLPPGIHPLGVWTSCCKKSDRSGRSQSCVLSLGPVGSVGQDLCLTVYLYSPYRNKATIVLGSVGHMYNA
ncbi:hypothetical protein Y1Q_0020989 [Alligator mississippiensis]|uniref:Uncharacterized protein n=1 Tax=Alligator mississippiensis TaxID=8496 RepID=A0A151MTM7_ALLMI|nr:hypothetical protein Y1Q_0020989 [Alligator mississippiensis]